MSLVVRVIPCLGANNERIVKGANFGNLRDTGDPVELVRHYSKEGVDELTFLDVTTSKDGRGTVLDVAYRTASEVFIPPAVGGGVCGAEDVDQLLRVGTDKVNVNTAAIVRLELLSELSHRFGVQCIVPSMSARRVPEGDTSQPSGFGVTTHGDSRSAGTDTVEWVRRGEEFGAGEILLDSMDGDGIKDGFDLGLLEKVRAAVDVPVIVSSSVDKTGHFPPAIRVGANMVLTISIFHSDGVSIAEVKEEMAYEGIEVCQ